MSLSKLSIADQMYLTDQEKLRDHRIIMADRAEKDGKTILAKKMLGLAELCESNIARFKNGKGIK